MAKIKNIGIPNAFIRHISGFDWKHFFELLGCNVTFSSKSTHALFKVGFNYAVNDNCLPAKLYYGHVAELDGNVDSIFIPQYISLKKESFSCPIVIGAKSCCKTTMKLKSDIISVMIDSHKPLKSLWSVFTLALQITKSPKKIVSACNYYRAEFIKEPPIDEPVESNEKMTIGVVGHHYALKDSFLNMGVIDKLQEYGYNVKISNVFSAGSIPEIEHFDCKQVHWDFGQEMIHAMHVFSNDPQISGIVFLDYFGCGINSFLEEIFINGVRESKPYLNLILDEHNGDAGVVTRLEAFLDMIKRKNRGAAYV